DQREHDPRHPAQRRRTARATTGRRHGTALVGRRAFARRTFGWPTVAGSSVGRTVPRTPRRRWSRRTAVGRAERLRFAGIGFDAGLEIGLAAAHLWAGSSSGIAPSYGPAGVTTERRRPRRQPALAPSDSSSG